MYHYDDYHYWSFKNNCDVNDIEKAKAGLEECRVDANTIWVKDCKTILETKARLK